MASSYLFRLSDLLIATHSHHHHHHHACCLQPVSTSTSELQLRTVQCSMLAMDDEAMMRVEVFLQTNLDIPDNLIGLPNPSPNISKAVRLGWCFGGYLKENLTLDEVKRVSCVAKGIARGVNLVEHAPVVLLM